MITLITAVPGSGKTLFVIGRILKAIEEGRSVYARVDGLLIEGVHDAPDDWRDTPEGSLVIYDEAQEIFPSNARPGPVTDERLTSMEVHRHTGHDLVFITQAPSFLHHHIRKLTGEHIHLYRPSGVQGAQVYTWGFTCSDPNDRREQERADRYFWKYPKAHFKLYKSATIHTHKFRIPRKITVILTVILIGALLVAYNLKDGFASSKIANDQALALGEKASATASPAPFNSSFDWKLIGYVLDRNRGGRSLALIGSNFGYRTIDFNMCDFDSYYLLVTCSVDGDMITFYTGAPLSE